jgi:predicted N-acyltransferase
VKEDTPRINLVETLAEVEPQAWNALVGEHPCLRHEFLHALHETGCACVRTGWKPQYLTLWQGTSLVGGMPLYLKSHSYGEYVFDWAWADAYHRHGLSSTPSCSARSRFHRSPGRACSRATDPRARSCCAAALRAAGREVSSLHVLFPTEPEAL